MHQREKQVYYSIWVYTRVEKKIQLPHVPILQL